MASVRSAAQSGYQTITVNDGGTITGSVKWTGPVPKIPAIRINKDLEICDPQAQKKRDLERLIVASNGGVANTVVFLKDITKGKAMDLPEGRQFLNQRTCRYEPHVLLVPDNGTLQLKSSDPVLHTVHMSGSRRLQPALSLRKPDRQPHHESRRRSSICAAMRATSG